MMFSRTAHLRLGFVAENVIWTTDGPMGIRALNVGPIPRKAVGFVRMIAGLRIGKEEKTKGCQDAAAQIGIVKSKLLIPLAVPVFLAAFRICGFLRLITSTRRKNTYLKIRNTLWDDDLSFGKRKLKIFSFCVPTAIASKRTQKSGKQKTTFDFFVEPPSKPVQEAMDGL